MKVDSCFELADTVEDSTGAFLKDCNVWEGGPDYTRNPQLAERLWQLSEKIVGEQFFY